MHETRARHQLSSAGRSADRHSDDRHARGRRLDHQRPQGRVANAPLAKLFAVRAPTADGAVRTFLVPRDTPGLSVHATTARTIASITAPAATVTFENCRVPADNLLGRRRRTPLTAERSARTLAGPGDQSRHRPRRLRGGARLRAAARAGRTPHHRASGDRHEARRDRDPARGRARRRSGRRPGPPTIPRRSPTAACPTCRSRPSPRCSPRRRSTTPPRTRPNASAPWA